MAWPSGRNGAKRSPVHRRSFSKRGDYDGHVPAYEGAGQRRVLEGDGREQPPELGRAEKHQHAELRAEDSADQADGAHHQGPSVSRIRRSASR